MVFQDTYNKYQEIERDRIQYTYCVDYQHISRYRALRQVVHQGQSKDRFIALETVNPFSTSANFSKFTVPAHLENRLDLIAEQKLGSATYAWVIAYVNKIQDGYTVIEGTELLIPNSITNLFEKHELLAPIEVQHLNLGSE